MPEQATISADLQLRRIVINAGGNPNLARYVDGVLFVRDVTQSALDAAVAAYDDAAERQNQKDDDFLRIEQTITYRIYFEVSFDQENRIRVLAAQPALTRPQFRMQLRNIFRRLT